MTEYIILVKQVPEDLSNYYAAMHMGAEWLAADFWWDCKVSSFPDTDGTKWVTSIAKKRPVEVIDNDANV